MRKSSVKNRRKFLGGLLAAAASVPLIAAAGSRAQDGDQPETTDKPKPARSCLTLESSPNVGIGATAASLRLDIGTSGWAWSRYLRLESR